MDRLTDSSKYTGSHKNRFDESGKGKGIEGREDRANAEGYVNGYKRSIYFKSKLTCKLPQQKNLLPLPLLKLDQAYLID